MTDKYAVIGNPIAHSKSPQIHRMFAEQTGQDICYVAIEAPLNGFAATIERLRADGYKGCNVTVPFKFEAYELASELSERAKSAQAVNTLRFAENSIFGDNTDGAGLVADIVRNLGVTLQSKRVLLMGAGGAAYGVALPISRSGAALHIVNRTAEKARLLFKRAETLGSMLDESLLGEYTLGQPVSYSDFVGLSKRQFDVVVNATSSGLSDEMPPLPPTVFAPNTLAYDMMYGRETPFMRFAREHGAAVVADGLGMLVEQAAESFYIWRGVRPDTAPVIAALRGQ